MGTGGCPCHRLLLLFLFLIVTSSFFGPGTFTFSFRGADIFYHVFLPQSRDLPILLTWQPRVLMDGAPCQLCFPLNMRLPGGEDPGRCHPRQSPH